jgi:hypothetical protein
MVVSFPTVYRGCLKGFSYSESGKHSPILVLKLNLKTCFIASGAATNLVYTGFLPGLLDQSALCSNV